MRSLTIEVEVTKKITVKKPVQVSDKYLDHDLSLMADSIKADILDGLYDNQAEIGTNKEAYDEDGKIMSGINWNK